MGLMYANVVIEGTKDLFFHTFNTDTLSLERKEKTGVAGNNPEEWKKTYNADENGQLYVDSSYVFGCLREGARHTPVGRSTLQPKLSSTLQVLNNRVYFNRYMPKELTQDSKEPVYLDVRGVRNPNTKGRNVRYRVALSPGWESSFEIVWENTLVSREQIPTILNDAGMLVGLADGRSIGYGRFVVKEINMMSYDEYKQSLGSKDKKKLA